MVAVSSSRVVAALVVWRVALGCTPACAQQSAVPPDDPVLQALVDEALAHSPVLHAAQSGLAAARTRVDQVTARPDPMVAVAWTNDGWGPSLGSMPMTTLGFMVSQEFPFAGKRQARADVAASQARALEPRLTRMRLGLEAAVRRAYAGLLLARERQSLTGEQRELWRQIEVVARQRYAVGQGAQQDVLRVQVEVTRIEQRAIEQALEADLRVAEINQLLARPIDSPVETSARLVTRPLPPTVQGAIALAREASPELEEARRGIATAQAELVSARREFKPDFTVTGGYMNRGGLDPMWLAGLGVSLPVNTKKRDSAVAEAEIRVKGGSHVVESIEVQLRFRTQERYARAKAAERVLALYEDGIVPQDRMTVEAAVANYQVNKVPFVSVLESMAALYADRWTRAGLLADHERLRVSLAEARLDEPAGMADVASETSAIQVGQAAGPMGGGMGGR
jgi:outer membrane protein, heavy metal efflux system